MIQTSEPERKTLITFNKHHHLIQKNDKKWERHHKQKSEIKREMSSYSIKKFFKEMKKTNNCLVKRNWDSSSEDECTSRCTSSKMPSHRPSNDQNVWNVLDDLKRSRKPDKCRSTDNKITNYFKDVKFSPSLSNSSLKSTKNEETFRKVEKSKHCKTESTSNTIESPKLNITSRNYNFCVNKRKLGRTHLSDKPSKKICASQDSKISSSMPIILEEKENVEQISFNGKITFEECTRKILEKVRSKSSPSEITKNTAENSTARQKTVSEVLKESHFNSDCTKLKSPEETSMIEESEIQNPISKLIESFKQQNTSHSTKITDSSSLPHESLLNHSRFTSLLDKSPEETSMMEESEIQNPITKFIESLKQQNKSHSTKIIDSSSLSHEPLLNHSRLTFSVDEHNNIRNDITTKSCEERIKTCIDKNSRRLYSLKPNLDQTLVNANLITNTTRNNISDENISTCKNISTNSEDSEKCTDFFVFLKKTAINMADKHSVRKYVSINKSEDMNLGFPDQLEDQLIRRNVAKNTGEKFNTARELSQIGNLLQSFRERQQDRSLENIKNHSEDSISKKTYTPGLDTNKIENITTSSLVDNQKVDNSLWLKLGLKQVLSEAKSLESETDENENLAMKKALNVESNSESHDFTRGTMELTERIHCLQNSNQIEHKCIEKLTGVPQMALTILGQPEEITPENIVEIPVENNREAVTNIPEKSPVKYNLLEDEEVRNILTENYEKYQMRNNRLEARNKSHIDSLCEKLNTFSQRERKHTGKCEGKCNFKRFRKGKMKIYRLAKLKKPVPHSEESGTLNIDELLTQMSQGFAKPKPNFATYKSTSSVSTTSSYLTDETSSDTLSTGSRELSSPQQKLRKGLNEICKDKSLFCDEQQQYFIKCDKDEIKMKIQNIFLQVFDDLTNGRRSCLKYRRQSIENCTVQDGRLQFKSNDVSMSVINSGIQRSQGRFKLILYILKKIQTLLETNTKLTKRELFYQLKHLIKDQRVSDKAINSISCLLDVGMWALNIVAQKGLVFGNLKILLASGETINCNVPGTLIPQDIGDIIEIHSTAFFILVIEKESIFHKLIEEDLPNRLTRPFVMVTGKGFPDLNTQLFLKKLWTVLSVPVFLLVDADPHGINIMLNYRFGSVSNAHVSHHLAVPHAKWLGVFPSEITAVNVKSQPLTVTESKLAAQLLRTPQVAEHPRIADEISFLIRDGRKAGIEGLIKTQVYLSEVYLPTKFFTKDFI